MKKVGEVQTAPNKETENEVSCSCSPIDWNRINFKHTTIKTAFISCLFLCQVYGEVSSDHYISLLDMKEWQVLWLSIL